MTTKQRATIEDLLKAEGNAELVDGRTIETPPGADAPGFAAAEIYSSLQEWTKKTGSGRARTDGTGYLVDLPHRESFSPDASLYFGLKAGGKMLRGAPIFAVEVRSESDFGRGAEGVQANKRADYFAAGTLVVWDVDLRSDDVVRVYQASDPAKPRIYRRGEIAEAEPAVPGWRMPVDNLFQNRKTHKR